MGAVALLGWVVSLAGLQNGLSYVFSARTLAVAWSPSSQPPPQRFPVRRQPLFFNDASAPRHPTARWAQAADDMSWDPKAAPKLDFDEDLYSVLEVDSAIAPKDLKKAYYKIVFKYHPDNKETAEAKALCNKQMMVINAAYKVLKDADARAKYDRKRRVGGFSSAGRTAGAASSSSPRSSSPRSSSSASASARYSAPPPGGGSSSGPFGKSYYPPNAPSDDAYATTDSLGDIFAEFWSELRRGDGKGIVDDVLDFLEDQVRRVRSLSCDPIERHLTITYPGYCQMPAAGGRETFTGWNPTGGEERTKARVDSEVQIMQSAVRNLKVNEVFVRSLAQLT